MDDFSNLVREDKGMETLKWNTRSITTLTDCLDLDTVFVVIVEIDR